MKKILSLLLLSVTALSLLGCVPYGEDPYAPDEDEEYVSAPEGYEYVIVCDTGADVTMVPLLGSYMGDRLLAHYAAIEEELGCVISAEEMMGEKISQKILAHTSADIKFADLVQTDAATISQLRTAGYLTPLEEIPLIDPTSEKWGLEGQRAFLSHEDMTYGFYGLWLGISLPTVSGVTLYNRDLLSEYSVPDPMELYEQGKWSWTSFADLSKKVTVTAGDDSDVYAFVLPDKNYPDLIHAAIHSNGGSRYTSSPTGDTVCGYNSYPTIDALTWVRSLVTDHGVAYPMKTEYDNGYLDVLAFTNRRTVFLVTNAYNGVCSYEDYPLATFGDSVGWLPFPKGPALEEAVKGGYFGYDDTFCAVATVDTRSVYNGAPILNALFEPMEGDDPTSWKDALYDGYFFDKDSFEVYFDLLTFATDGGQIQAPSLNAPIDEKFAMVISGEESAAKAVEEIESVVNGLITEE